ncbi:PIG-L family deacetylase [Deinococcus sp. Marseille-Q6407]|uniref:PIG-L family deacetylase n=1 Tax=Deinococcus sp. Marseille-Q6407 TaxID=2969223 RepID=UPI0021C1F4DE|nr:PIG-L family deacetylase [Deinococcus sp. Marseille-Q6407]
MTFSLQTVYGKVQPLDWLVLAPHPDDAEIGAGGTLIRVADAGGHTGILELTRGEMGTLGTPEVRMAECAAAAAHLGLGWRGTLGLPDGGLHDDPVQAAALAAALRLLRPRVLVVPHPSDRHPDHYGAYALGKRAVHLAGLRRADVPGEPHRPGRVLLFQGNADIRPGLLVDVEASLPRWEAAIRAHESQFSGEAVSETVTPEVVDRRLARLGYWGTLARVRYAEAFGIEGELLLDPAAL